MIVKIDEDLCIACGICEQICPKAFAMNESNDLALVIAYEEELEYIDCVEEAANSCPVAAIIIEI
jgi:ferredoxin